MKRHDGFSLVELLIVVAIILVIAAIAIPNLLRSRLAANEASATSSLRTLNTAEVTYVATYKSGFTDTLNRLGPSSTGTPDVNNADLVDPVLSGRSTGGGTNTFIKAGYTFTYTPVGAFPSISQYNINANPQVRGNTGQRSFFSDASAVVRSNATTAASASDAPI